MIEDAEDRMSDDNQDDDELEEVSKQLATKSQVPSWMGAGSV